jgi:hypothetical protein
MSDQFYIRATGKLSAGKQSSITEIKKSKRDSSTVYSIDDDESDSAQYPLEILSKSQIKYIETFVRALTDNNSIEIDPSLRGIHWIGIWKAPKDAVTISCSFTQPHITACVITPKSSSYRSARLHADQYFVNQDKGHPTIIATNTSYQLFGKYSIPLMDSLIEHNVVREQNVHWSNVIIGQTQPIFVIISQNGAHECSLTYNSCLILDEASPNTVNVSHPVTGTLNFSFRSSKVSERDGEGGHMTVHGSGIIQCQGNPTYIRETMQSFRECILRAMKQEYISRFMDSLNVIRKI